jgi:hypothetical protein
MLSYHQPPKSMQITEGGAVGGAQICHLPKSVVWMLASDVGTMCTLAGRMACPMAFVFLLKMLTVLAFGAIKPYATPVGNCSSESL